MEREERATKCQALLDDIITEIDPEMPGLADGLYTMSEIDLFDSLHIDPGLAILIWAAVERIRRAGFPAELRV